MDAEQTTLGCIRKVGLNGLRNTIYSWRKYFLVLLGALAIPAYADFVNGNFDAPYPNGDPLQPITGWTLTGYLYNGATAVPPTSIVELNLAASGPAPEGISDIVNAPTAQSLFDYFLFGATPTPTQKIPLTGMNSAMVNLRSINTPYTVSGITGKPPGWITIARQATSYSQTITVQPSDFDPVDGRFHVRFKVAGVLENPAHNANEQPFAAVQLNNISTGRTGANPLFFEWIYSDEPGIPWQSITTAGTNPGSNTSYLYSDIRGFDISQSSAFVQAGQSIELVVLASGCSIDGHDGHLYLDDVHTGFPSSLWIDVNGPASAAVGQTITYTYTYTNNQGAPASNVVITVSLPTRSTPTAAPTTFISVSTPTVGTSPSCAGTGPITCNIGTLAANETGTFQLVVNIPGSWTSSQGPVNNGNYSISDATSYLLGPIFHTNLVDPASLSNLVVGVGGLPVTATVGTAYTGNFTCSNTPTGSATGSALSATCDVANLPTGVNVTGCAIGVSPWVAPDTIPSGETVTCSVSGTPSVAGTFNTFVNADADNNSNSTTNHITVPITVSSQPAVIIPATLNGSPVLDRAAICCGRPILLGPLPVPGSGATTYSVISRTGNVQCFIGNTGTQTYLKAYGSNGSCTIIGTKNGVTSASLTITTP